MNVTKNKKKWWILTSVIILIAVVYLYNRSFISAYYNNIRNNPFTPGERIIADKTFMEFPHTESFCRLAKNNSGYVPIYSDILISSDSLKKYKTNYIGTYIGFKLAFFNIHDEPTGKDTSGVMILYKINPNTQGIKTCKPGLLPKGYTYVDSNYYMFSVMTRRYKKK